MGIARAEQRLCLRNSGTSKKLEILAIHATILTYGTVGDQDLATILGGLEFFAEFL